MSDSLQAILFITISWSLLKFMSTELAMPSNHLILVPFYSCLQFFPAPVFSNDSTLHIKWPTYWSFSFNMSPFNEYSGLISFWIDWFDLFAVQESSPTLQFESISSSTLRLLYGQLSHQYMTTGKTITLTRQTFVSKVMSLLFNTLFGFVFLPRSKCLLISWL